MRVVVINLDRSPDRLAMFREQAERLGIAFERLPAIDAETVRTKHGDLTKYEIACFESHRLAWKSLVDSGESGLAVFEDDVWLAQPIASLLAMASFPPDIDLIKLETFAEPVRISPKAVPLQGFALHRLQTLHWGSAGYILSRHAAIQLLARTEAFQQPIDMLIFDPEGAVSREMRILQVVPALCIQEHLAASLQSRPVLLPSLIDHSRIAPIGEPRKLGAMTKIGRELRRMGVHVVEAPTRLRKAFRPSREIVVPFRES